MRDGRPLRGPPGERLPARAHLVRAAAGLGSRVPPERDGGVWQLAEHRYLYIEELPERAGHALHTVFVDDLDERVESIGARGIEPASQETYGNGVRKVIYRDPDGNEIGFGGAPRSSDRRVLTAAYLDASAGTFYLTTRGKSGRFSRT
jgi:hypothetical protein